ncbi:MAG: flagellar biosynthetic protein FliR [Alphaproteobacteria bacterium]|nr:flagellar biosynthetic protein FliR [Alphaproteobacteria bacterium]
MLEQFLVTELFAFLLVFSRLGSSMMLLPGIGEVYVSARARLMLALMISLLVTPIAQPLMPDIPNSPFGLAVLLAAEITIGVFIGLLSRILISALHTAGMIIAFQSGLAAAMMFDINAGTQGSPFGNLLTLGAVMLIFTLNLHHLMLMGVADSYTLFAPGNFPPVGDFAQMAAQIISSVFLIALAFSSPHIIVGLLVYLSAGIMSRLMPAMQVFFVIMPAQILASVLILTVTVSSGMLMYMAFFENMLSGFLTPQ